MPEVKQQFPMWYLKRLFLFFLIFHLFLSLLAGFVSDLTSVKENARDGNRRSRYSKVLFLSRNLMLSEQICTCEHGWRNILASEDLNTAVWRSGSAAHRSCSESLPAAAFWVSVAHAVFMVRWEVLSPPSHVGICQGTCGPFRVVGEAAAGADSFRLRLASHSCCHLHIKEKIFGASSCKVTFSLSLFLILLRTLRGEKKAKPKPPKNQNRKCLKNLFAH